MLSLERFIIIIEFSQFDQDALFNLEKYSNSKNIFNIFYRFNFFNLEVIKAY
jgi:hypothetical protein